MNKPEYMNDGASKAAGSCGRHGLTIGIANMAATCLLATAMVVWLAPEAEPAGSGWTAEHQRMLAAKLHTEGMPDRAYAAFGDYIRQYALTSVEIARVSYLMGSMRYDQQRYDEALECFYRVGVADPSSPQAAEAGRKIVTCLDRLGRTIDAKYALDRETALRTPTQEVRGTVVAKVGNDVITLRDVQNEMQKMPPSQQKELGSRERQGEFLRQYVAQRLLFRKAQALGLDRKDEVRDAVAAFERQMVVQSLLEDEVKKRAVVERGDVKLFYEAHRDLFSTPAKAKAVVVVCSNSADAASVLRSLRGGDTGVVAAVRLRGVVHEGETTGSTVAGLGHEPSLAAAILAQRQGTLSNIVPVAKGFAAALVQSHHDATVMPFTEAQGQAERMYRTQKEQQALQDIVDEMMKAERVQLYPERLEPASPQQAGGTAQ